jgi:hypothetical protein
VAVKVYALLVFFLKLLLAMCVNCNSSVINYDPTVM